MSSDFEQELIRLRRALFSMGACAELRVTQAFDALLRRDVGVAQAVRENDDEVDNMDLDIEDECLRILALQHPVAGDLRFVLTALRMSIDLERIADLARGIAKRVIRMSAYPPLPFPPALPEMADAARKMLAEALTALAKQEVARAEEVRRADSFVDQKHKQFFEWVVTDLPRHGEHARAAVDLLFVGRAIERIGDLSTNIAEDVIFAFRGDVVRHRKP